MDNEINEIERIRYIYFPSTIKCMLIAESPPGNGRFFYSPDSTEYDYLFLSVMDCLYSGFTESYMSFRNKPRKKYEYLCRFRDDGFYLFDVYRDRSEIKEMRPKDAIDRTIRSLDKLGAGKAPIIIIKTTIYDLLASILSEAGLNLVRIRIPFPSHHWQGHFKRQFIRALRQIGWNGRWILNVE